MLCPGRTRPAGCVGAGCRYRNTGLTDQFSGARMRWHPYRYRLKPSCGLKRNLRCLLKDQSHWSRPESLHQSFCFRRDSPDNRLQFLSAANMEDQRIVTGASFGLINLHGSFFHQTIASQTVYGLRRESNQAAFTQHSCRIFQFIFLITEGFVPGYISRLHLPIPSILKL